MVGLRLTFAAACAALVLLAAPLTAAAQSAREPGDAFGQETTLTPRTFLYLKGQSTWDTAFDTLVDAFKTVSDFLKKEGITPAGQPMTVYTSADDTGFAFQAGVPINQEPANRPTGDLEIGKSPEGKALKFVHRGSFDNLVATYDAITNHLDEKGLESQDFYVEQYLTDPAQTPEDMMVIEVYVPLK